MLSKWLQHKQSGQDLRSEDNGLVFLFLLGFVEFLTAAVVVLLIGKDPKNALIFGYSLQRIGLFFLILFPGIILLLLAIKTYRGSSWPIFRFLKGFTFWADLSFLLFNAGFLVLIFPSSELGIFHYYFDRLRPLLLVICFLPIQFSFRWMRKDLWKFDKRLLICVLTCLSLIILLLCFIVFSRMGITPDKLFWNVAGMPISSIQLITILLGIMICLRGVAFFRKYIPNLKANNIDLVLCVALFLGAFLIWNKTPMQGHFFSTDPAKPYYQPFPFSDAQELDLGALSILKGWGINFSGHTDKPLYNVFLSILHVFSGYDYNRLTQLQILFLALIPVVLYLFGKSFHGRFFGLLIASIIIVRQSNAIILSRMIASANPRLLTSEVPTLLGLIVFGWLVFLWLRKGEKHPWIALLSGGILGMTSLIRENPVLILPAFPMLLLFALWTTKKKWLSQSILFMAGFFILVAPWIFTGVSQYGQPYFFQKFFGVINSRYAPINQVPNIIVEVASSEGAPFGLLHAKVALGNFNQAKPLININQFPGFVLNHFLHNLIGTFLALPDSVFPADQVITIFHQKPYWVEGGLWAGQIEARQIPFIFLNICLGSLGIGWSWKRWRWAGMVPLFILLVYSLSLGLARTSGSRYIVPVDWVVFFYFSMGITLILGFLLKIFKIEMKFDLDSAIDPQPLATSHQKNKRLLIATILFLLCVASFIPIADKLIPPEKSLCNKESLSKVVSQIDNINPGDKAHFFTGEVLYPDISENTLTFTLLTCRRVIPLEASDFNDQVGNGQTVIVGLSTQMHKPEVETIYSLEDGSPQIIWAKK